MCAISVRVSVWMHTRVVLVWYACVVKKNTLVILISFSIHFSIWMVVKCFVTIQITWIVAKDLSRPSIHPSQSLDGHWRFVTTIHPLLPSATKLRRLCFYRRLSVHRVGWGCLLQYILGYHTPWSRHPPGSRHPQSRHPPEQTPQSRPPQSGHPPRADTPQEADTPQSRHPPPEIRSLLRTVRILLECILIVNIFITFSAKWWWNWCGSQVFRDSRMVCLFYVIVELSLNCVSLFD